jgi:hypothetical protein
MSLPLCGLQARGRCPLGAVLFAQQHGQFAQALRRVQQRQEGVRAVVEGRGGHVQALAGSAEVEVVAHGALKPHAADRLLAPVAGHRRVRHGGLHGEAERCGR